MKQYKPGQFVSIGGKLARVCKKKFPLTICDECVIINRLRSDKYCNNSECLEKLGKEFYPKLIKQCGNQGK